MKKLMLILFSFILFACSNVVKEESTLPIIEANAVIFNNNLPVDGCAEHISIIDKNGDKIKDLLPTEATMATFKNLLDIEIAKFPKETYTGNIQIPVTIKYIETSEKGELLCGWGNKSIVERVEIVSITKK